VEWAYGEEDGKKIAHAFAAEIKSFSPGNTSGLVSEYAGAIDVFFVRTNCPRQ
jgi:hypothetical protein